MALQMAARGVVTWAVAVSTAEADLDVTDAAGLARVREWERLR